MFGFLSFIQICIVQCYPATKYSTNEVNIFKLISLLSFCMLMDKCEMLQTTSGYESEDRTEETRSISDLVQNVCMGG